MKRTLSLVLALVMVLGTFTSVFAAEQSVEAEAGKFLQKVEVLAGVNAEGDLNLEGNFERRDQVILLSKLMKQFEVAKDFPTLSTWTDNNDTFYDGFLGWAQANKYFAGKSTTEFGPRESITAQDYAAVLLRVLGYAGEDATKTYADSIKLAKELGILKGMTEVDNSTKITRGQMSLMTYNALEVEIKDSTITLAEKLEITMPVAPVVEATKVESVTANNLKEVVVVFDGEVEKTSAEDKANYSIVDFTIEDAELSEDLTTVTLTVKEVLNNQKEHELTVLRVKAGNKVLSTEKVKFTPLDNALPQVEEVKSLGTKALKVVVSEPVKNPSVSSFKIDGKAYFGTVAANGREITLKPYSSTSVLSVGTHTLEVSGLTDYFNLKSLKQDFSFEVVEDKNAPTIVSATGTLEKVVVTFDEDIDPDTVNKDNFYWKSGNTKMKPNAVKTSGNKVTLDFTTNKLPAYQTDLYVVNVADYSANKMAETAIAITATVDQTRPVVLDASVSADSNKEVIVRFDKNVKAERSNFVFKNKDGKALSVNKIDMVEKNVVKVTLYNDLPAGINTLDISGVEDTTTLKNVMIPQSFNLDVNDKSRPEVKSVSANSDTRTIIVNYSKTMNLASIADSAKYLIRFEGSYRGLPNGTEITPVQDGKSVMIVLPEKIGTKTVKFLSGNVDEIQVMGVEDTLGNILDGYLVNKSLITASKDALVAKYDKDATGNDVYAAFLDGETIKIKFNQGIGEVVGNPITVANLGATVTVETDGSETVTLKLSKDIGTVLPAGVTISIKGDDDNNKLVTLTGGKAAAKNLVVENIEDRVKPVVKVEEGFLLEMDAVGVGESVYYNITVPFSETLNNVAVTDVATTNSVIASDFEVVRVVDGKVLVANVDFTTTIENDTVVIKIDSDAVKAGTEFEVKVKDGARYLQDITGNKAEESAKYYTGHTAE